MKRLCLFIIFYVLTFYSVNAQLKSEVSECFELTSIAFRIAGAPEYINNQLQDYTGKIDKYFAPYNNHPLIPFLKEMRNEYGVGYDAVSSVTAYLVIKKGNVIVNPLLSISEISKFDSRWTEENLKTFVKQLNDFYKKTNFRDFYLQHTDLYKVAVERMDNFLKDINPEWFESFFGEKFDDKMIIVSLCNGSSNYSFRFPEKKGDLKDGIVIGVSSDQSDLPCFPANSKTIIIHELLHHYTNRRIDLYWPQIKIAAEKIYPHVKEKMFKNAYGKAKTVMGEWFNNLCEILYIQDNPGLTLTFEQLTGLMEYKGFIWMGRSVQFMKHFYENRNIFVTIDDYMPQIVGFVNYTADNFDQVIEEYNNCLPYIVDVFPAPGSTISKEIKAIEVYFSKPMLGSMGIKNIDNKNVIPLPCPEEPYWKNKFVFVIPFDSALLEKGKTYGCILLRKAFQDNKMFAIKEDFIYTLNTSDK